MKVLLLSTSDKTGGAAIACTRIFRALAKSGADVSMLVRDKASNYPDIFTLNTSILRRAANFALFCLERLRILLHPGIRRKSLFQVSLDCTGAVGLISHPLVRDADVINIHWTSQGMLSIRQLRKLLEMGKMIVFTMHDMHQFAGICHYAGNCAEFSRQCGNCQYIADGKNEGGLSRRWLLKKMRLPNRGNIAYIACSKWLAGVARQSAMLKDASVDDIPNPIDAGVFSPMNKMEARRRFSIGQGKRVVLFGAANAADERKGFRYIAEALNILNAMRPDYIGDIELLIFGKCSSECLDSLPFHCTMAGYLSSDADIVAAYSAADVYVTPSLEDNLPNTVMEAMACSLPCVAFDTGGLPQLIGHLENGYLARYKDAGDLAHGIDAVLGSPSINGMRLSARRKVLEQFSESVVAQQYINAFNKLFQISRHQTIV